MNKLKKSLLVVPLIGTLMVLLGCIEQPPPPPPPPPIPVCVEESSDQSPKVFEYAWTYPDPVEFKAPCRPEFPETQVDLWISLAAGYNVAETLCNSKFGLPKGPIAPGAVWLICMDVRRSTIGLT
jgi:hypothetical protein